MLLPIYIRVYIIISVVIWRHDLRIAHWRNRDKWSSFHNNQLIITYTVYNKGEKEEWKNKKDKKKNNFHQRFSTLHFTLRYIWKKEFRQSIYRSVLAFEESPQQIPLKNFFFLIFFFFNVDSFTSIYYYTLCQTSFLKKKTHPTVVIYICATLRPSIITRRRSSKVHKKTRGHHHHL